MFRRYEFRGLLNRIDDLEDAIPAAVPVPVAGTVVPWREGELPQVRGRAGLAVADGRFALAQEDGVIVGPWDEGSPARLRDAELVAHDFKSLPRLTMRPADDTLIEAYLIEPGRSEYAIGDLQREYGLEVIPGAGDGGGDGGADHARRGRAPAGRADARARRRAWLRASRTTRSS